MCIAVVLFEHSETAWHDRQTKNDIPAKEGELTRDDTVGFLDRQAEIISDLVAILSDKDKIVKLNHPTTVVY